MTDKKKEKPESLDFLLAAIAPVFIIGMIGSLVYFLIAVAYQGSHTERLKWILGLYTVAAVLIARIAIEQSRQVAFGYMFALAIATLAVTPQLFEVRGAAAAFSFPILVFMLGLVATLADRITHDCTSMNEQAPSTGVGLLQSLGLVKSDRNLSSTKRSEPLSIEAPAPNGQKKASVHRKHNPGVWVLYFSLLALPLFGLGQLTIQSPVDRSWSFTYLFFYLLNSLFLLVLISLLSLRKYLRERGVPMETSFALRWLAIGMTSVLIVLTVLSLLPIPSQSLLSMELPFRITSREDLKANRWGWGREGAEGEGPRKGDGNAQDKADKPDQPNENNGRQGPAEGGKEEGDKQAPDKQASKNQSGEVPSDDGKQKGPEQKNGEQRGEAKHPEGGAPPPKTPSPSMSIQWNGLASLQWLLMIALAIAALVTGIVYRRELLAAIRTFRDWLIGIFGGGKRLAPSRRETEENAAAPIELYPPFHTFSNPFVGNGWTSEQVVRHIYRATLSWGYEHRIARREDETPEEFMRRLFRRFPEQQESFSALGLLYNRIAYARGKVSQIELGPMKALWQWLEQKTPQPKDSP